MQVVTLNYITEAGVSLNSRLYLPDGATDERVGEFPAVLVFPEWWGLSDHVQERAQALAKLGYVALAVDMYGEGRITSDASVANERMSELLQHPDLLAERIELAYNNLRAVAEVNPSKMAAIGFCFGGRVVLQMAREGLDLRSVVSFHGFVTTDKPVQKGMVQAAILVEHGELDTMCTLDDVAAFRAEMDAAQVEYQVDVLPNARHGFTNPQATENGQRNGADLAYDAAAAQQAWDNALAWLARTLA